jgi:hypothetical protein
VASPTIKARLPCKNPISDPFWALTRRNYGVDATPSES